MGCVASVYLMRLQDWSNAGAIAKAFTIGRGEAQAVSHLQCSVSKGVVKILKQCVAVRGMKAWLQHDCIGKGPFNVGFSSATSSSEQWSSALTNGEDDRLVILPAKKHRFRKIVFWVLGKSHVAAISCSEMFGDVW